MPQQFERPTYARTLASTFLARVDETKSTPLWRGEEGAAKVLGVSQDDVVDALDMITQNPSIMEIADGLILTAKARQALEDLRNNPSSDLS